MTTTLCCWWRHRAAGLHRLRRWRLHCAVVSGAGLQGSARGHGDYTVLLLTAQGRRATLHAAVAYSLCCCEWRRAARLHCLRLSQLHCAPVDGARLQGYIACCRGDYAALLWVAQGCRASLLAAMAATLRCCWRRRAAELHCLRLWRIHCAASSGAELQSFIACGYGVNTLNCCGRCRAAAGQCLRQWRVQCALSGGAGPQGCIVCGCGEFTAAVSGEGLQSFMACGYSDYSRAAEHAIDVDSILRGVVLFYSVGAEGGLRRLPEADCYRPRSDGGAWVTFLIW